MPRPFLASSEKKPFKRPHDGAFCPNYLGMTRTVLFNSLIEAEIFLDLHNSSNPTKPHSIIANNTKKPNFL